VLDVFYPFVWFSTEFRARVVDESTGRPVPGAIVLATWELMGGVFHMSTQGVLKVSEVVTGPDGAFHIPAWGPRFAFGLGRLQTQQPHMRILSPGYYPLFVDNQPQPMTVDNYARADTLIRFLYQDQDLKLKPRDQDLAAYEGTLNYLVGTELAFIYYNIRRGCDWRSAPRTLAFVHDRKLELSRYKRGASLYYVTQLSRQTECGDTSPADLAREYLQ